MSVHRAGDSVAIQTWGEARNLSYELLVEVMESASDLIVFPCADGVGSLQTDC